MLIQSVATSEMPQSAGMTFGEHLQVNMGHFGVYFGNHGNHLYRNKILIEYHENFSLTVYVYLKL